MSHLPSGGTDRTSSVRALDDPPQPVKMFLLQDSHGFIIYSLPPSLSSVHWPEGTPCRTASHVQELAGHDMLAFSNVEQEIISWHGVHWAVVNVLTTQAAVTMRPSQLTWPPPGTKSPQKTAQTYLALPPVSVAEAKQPKVVVGGLCKIQGQRGSLSEQARAQAARPPNFSSWQLYKEQTLGDAKQAMKSQSRKELHNPSSRTQLLR